MSFKFYGFKGPKSVRLSDIRREREMTLLPVERRGSGGQAHMKGLVHLQPQVWSDVESKQL